MMKKSEKIQIIKDLIKRIDNLYEPDAGMLRTLKKRVEMILRNIIVHPEKYLEKLDKIDYEPRNLPSKAIKEARWKNCVARLRFILTSALEEVKLFEEPTSLKEDSKVNNINEIPVIIDGPNFICRIIDLGIDNDLIARQLKLEGLREIISKHLSCLKIPGECGIIEFICSKKMFGPETKKFKKDEKDLLIKRIGEEVGVYVIEVDITGSREKGVDNMVSTRIEKYAEKSKCIILISADKDYIPLLRRMKEKEKKIIVVSLQNNFPYEIINEAYAKIDIKKDYEYIFDYHYPQYWIHDFDFNKCREMISNADDRVNNQIRVNKNGLVYISSKAVGAKDLTGVKYYFETFIAKNGYVGPQAASNLNYIKEIFNKIKLAWKK